MKYPHLMEEELEIKFNTKKIKELIKKYQILLILLIPIFLAIFFRAYPYTLPVTEDLAESSVENQIKENIRAGIISNYPDLDNSYLENAVNQEYFKFKKENSESIKASISNLKQTIKNYYQNENGQTYLLAIDPYHYYRQAQNFLKNGHVGDELKDGKPLDNHMLAPNGKVTSNDLHSIIGATFHKISSFFGNDSLLKTMFIIPLLFATLSIIPTFFIAKKIGGNLGGAIAAFIIAIHPTFLSRTAAGFSDTDAYSIFFPLMIIWCFLETFTATKFKRKLIFGTLTGLFIGIFSFAWSGWWYIFDIILASIIVYFLYLFIKYRKKVFKKLKTKNLIKTAIITTLSSAIFVSIFKNFNTFLSIFKEPISIIFLKQVAHPTLWPNVYTTVAELNKVSMSTVISSLGGTLLFALCIIGLLLIFLKKNKKQAEIKYGILMLIWFLGMLYSTTKGIRFIMFMIPIFSIGVGIFISKLYDFTLNWSSKELHLNKKILSILLIIVIIFSFTPLVKSANQTAKSEFPTMNDGWYDSLTKIKQETSEDSIITSWWDFGHWFKAIADRAVTFDGASQNRPQAHWVGKILLTDDEKESLAILRMLNCGGNDAYDLLLEETNDPIITKKIIEEIILTGKNTAKNILEEYTNNPEKILEKTHCENQRPNYFITSQDMVSKGGVWAHFGSWSFERAFIYNVIKTENKDEAIKTIMEKLDYSKEETSSIYVEVKQLSEEDANFWIAPYPSFSNEGYCQTQDNTVFCNNGVMIDLNNNLAYVQTNSGQELIKKYRDDKTTYINGEGINDISIAYLPEESKTVLMHPELLDSLFVDLYYYKGKNLNHFSLFDHRVGIDGFEIYTWEVKW
jgi:dolichyl-phosphooligosaccharide-protein glycotransferase